MWLMLFLFADGHYSSKPSLSKSRSPLLYWRANPVRCSRSALGFDLEMSSCVAVWASLLRVAQLSSGSESLVFCAG